MPPRPLPRVIDLARLPALGLALCLLVPLWWLIPGLWAGWWLGGRRRPDPDQTGPVADLRFVAALPLAFGLPALLLPVARLLHLPWKEIWLAAAIAGGALGLRRLVRGATARDVPTPDTARAPAWPLLAVGAAAVGVACWWPLRGLLAPAGVDMAMHMTFARLLWQQPLAPLTQDPIWPGVPLGAYPLGFHAGAALTALVTGDLLRAGLLATAATHALVPVATYLCIQRAGHGERDLPAALAALLVAWIARNPQAYVGWGGNPCVLATALALVAARLLLAPPAGRAPWSVAVEAGLLVAATALTHPTPAAVLPYVVVVALPILAWAGAARLDAAAARRLLFAALVAAAAIAPQLPATRATAVSDAEVAWVREHHRLPPQAPEPGIGGAVRYVKGQYDDTMAILFVAALAAGAVRLRRPRVEIACAAGLAALVALACLAAAWRLPPALALYPERIMPLALPLFALAIRRSLAGATVGDGDALRRARRRPLTALAAGIAVALAVLAIAKHDQFYARKARDGAFVTEADLLAFAWIGTHAPPRALIDANYGDAGAWLPAATGHPVTRPQTNPVWIEEMRAATASAPVVLRYVGARLWVGADSVSATIAPHDVLFTGRAGGLTAVVARARDGAQGRHGAPEFDPAGP